MSTNRIVVDLAKVQWAKLVWSNGLGCERHKKPRKPTVNGEVVGDEPAMYHCLHPGETMLERAKRRGMLDEWTPVLHLQLTANHSLTYTGKKALSIWKEWNRRVYGK